MRERRTRVAYAEADRDSTGWFGFIGLALATLLVLETVWSLVNAVLRGWL